MNSRKRKDMQNICTVFTHFISRKLCSLLKARKYLFLDCKNFLNKIMLYSYTAYHLTYIWGDVEEVDSTRVSEYNKTGI